MGEPTYGLESYLFNEWASRAAQEDDWQRAARNVRPSSPIERLTGWSTPTDDLANFYGWLALQAREREMMDRERGLHLLPDRGATSFAPNMGGSPLEYESPWLGPQGRPQHYMREGGEDYGGLGPRRLAQIAPPARGQGIPLNPPASDIYWENMELPGWQQSQEIPYQDSNPKDWEYPHGWFYPWPKGDTSLGKLAWWYAKGKPQTYQKPKPPAGWQKYEAPGGIP